MELLYESGKFGCGLRSFRERGRIGNLQMQRRDVRMQKIATIERTCDCHRPCIFAPKSTGTP